MKATILYRPNSEHARTIEQYMTEFSRRTGKMVEMVDVDSVEGSNMATLYGTVEYPAILVLANDGQMQQMWTGVNLPMMNELSSYLMEN